jgi:hypothetical protein
MACHLHLRPDLDNRSRTIDQEGGALDTHIGPAIHGFFDPDTERLADVRCVIGAKLTGQAVLRPEFGLFRRGVL